MQYVINLRRRPDREREFFLRWPTKQKKPEVYRGMDGQTISKAGGPFFEYAETKVLQDHLVRSFDISNLQRGEFGCYLSHVSLWMRLAQMPQDTFFMIFEDDAQFGKAFEKDYSIAVNFLDLHRTDSIFLYMGGIPFQMKRSFEASLVDIPGLPISRGVRGLCLHAQGLTSSMARLLLQEIFQKNVKQWPIDVHLTHYFRKHPEQCYSMNPLISQSLPQWSSDIQTVWDKVFRVPRTDLVAK